jgi:hypothetical protein
VGAEADNSRRRAVLRNDISSRRIDSRQNAERFIGQRRGAGVQVQRKKVDRRDGELKTYWTEPAGLAGELLYGR